MKSIFIKSNFLIAIFFSFSLLKAQVAIPDSIEIDNSITTKLKTHDIELKKFISQELKNYDVQISKISKQNEKCGNKLIDAARLQNQSRQVLVVGTLLGVAVLTATGNIPVTSLIFGVASLISISNSIKSTKYIKFAGEDLLPMN